MPKGIYIKTEAHKKKLSEALKGKKLPPFSDEHKRKLSIANTGKKRLSPSEETREKLRNALKGKKRPPFSNEWKKNISESHKGKIGYWLGKKRSEETIQKMREKATGEKSSRWKNGISKLSGYNSFRARRRRTSKTINGGFHTFADWETLKAQYNWTCPSCKKQEPEIKLSEDHIIPLSKGGSDNIENIQPLCINCNCKKHTKIIRYDLENKKNPAR